MKRSSCRLWVRVATLALGAFASGAGSAEPRRPSVVFILTDDQRWDMMGVVQREQGERARFPWLKTPHLDRLASEGVRFRNAFVVNSLCSPSRATFLTGQYGHANGIVNNRTPFPADNVTWATELRGGGYATAYFGKWHMGSQAERPGFDHVASFVGQGVYFGCKLLINGTETKTEGYVDDVTTGLAIDYMREHKDRPFAMVLGLKATHGPFDPPPRRAKEYEGEVVGATPNLATPAIYLGGGAGAGGAKARVDKVNWGYLRCIAGIDDNVGRVLAAIDELGLREDTIVVFAGDNGYYLREHHLGDKRTAYEESLRIPLLLRDPRGGSPGRAVDGMVLNTDLAPTLLDLVGMRPPATMQGRSWRPLLSGAAPGDWRKAWFYCYFREQRYQAPMTTAVRTETAKLIRYPGREDWTEMFDLLGDPYETRNLFADPAHAALRKQLEAEFDRQAAAVGFHVPDFADKDGVEAVGPSAPRKNAWVLEYRFDRDEGQSVMDATGSSHHGTAFGAPLVAGRDGRKARAFDGKGHIDVPKSAALDPSRGPWTVEVSFLADQPDGVVLARGGKTNGYILYLAGGRPAFAVASEGSLSQVRGKVAVTGRWVAVRATVTADRQLVLAVDGAPAVGAPLEAFIAKDPNDAMQIGADHKTPVLARNPPGFVGRIDSVRIFSGAAP